MQTGTQPAEGPGSLVSPSWLAANLGPSVVVLDATVDLPPASHDGDYRPAAALEQFAAGHIPAARHADLLGDLSDPAAPYHFARPPADQLAAALEELGVTDSSFVVTYDAAGGVWAARLWWMLRWISIPAAILDGGWAGWLASGGAVEDGAPPDLSTTAGDRPSLTWRERPGMWAGKSDVLDIVGGSQPGSLVCALSPELFTGTAPTRYTRRGHIPSSVNIPARSLQTASGQLRPLADLEEATAFLAGSAPVTVYCGGGISAAVVAHALSVTGRDDVAIYDGSLEEWSADAGLPLELGTT
jgi:thiosulfate/3-mercaptopyruvate sulfurtransferase